MSDQPIGIVVHGTRYVTVTEASTILHVSRRTLYNWIALGKIVSFCNPGGSRYIAYDSITMTPQPADSIQPGY